MSEQRTWSVPVYAYATTATDFTTDIDPREDPNGFEDAFMAFWVDPPGVNHTNDFEIDGEWEISKDIDGIPDAVTFDK